MPGPARRHGLRRILIGRFTADAVLAGSAAALVGCDNTWATPLLFKPLDHGADFAMEALTKYVGGLSDLLLGSVSVRGLALRGRLEDTMRMIGIRCSLVLASMPPAIGLFSDCRSLRTNSRRISWLNAVIDANRATLTTNYDATQAMPRPFRRRTKAGG